MLEAGLADLQESPPEEAGGGHRDHRQQGTWPVPAHPLPVLIITDSRLRNAGRHSVIRSPRTAVNVPAHIRSLAPHVVRAVPEPAHLEPVLSALGLPARRDLESLP